MGDGGSLALLGLLGKTLDPGRLKLPVHCRANYIVVVFYSA